MANIAHKIPLFDLNYGKEEEYAVLETLRSKWISMGPNVYKLEEDFTKHIKFLVNQVRDGSKGYYHPEMGFNYRMTNIEAALGLAQLTKINTFLRKKKAFWKTYQNSFKNLNFIKFQQEYQGAHSSWWLTCIKVSPPSVRGT